MKSMTLLEYQSEKTSLDVVAHEFNSNWMSAIYVLDLELETYLGADIHGNVFLVERNHDAKTDDQMAQLKMLGGFNLGDYINVFVACDDDKVEGRQGMLVGDVKRGEFIRLQETRD